MTMTMVVVVDEDEPRARRSRLEVVHASMLLFSKNFGLKTPHSKSRREEIAGQTQLQTSTISSIPHHSSMSKTVQYADMFTTNLQKHTS